MKVWFFKIEKYDINRDDFCLCVSGWMLVICNINQTIVFKTSKQQCLKHVKFIMDLQFEIEHQDSSVSYQPLPTHLFNHACNLDYSPIFYEFVDNQHNSISFQESISVHLPHGQINPDYPTTDKQNRSQTNPTQTISKKQKNNNSIKKIGRLILDHIKQYSLRGKTNFALTNMLRMLSRNSRVGRTEVKKRDKFNTHHLAQLFNDKNQDVRVFNLLTTKRILCRYLRKNVKNSYQISEPSKLIYLNTLKCTALRCSNSKLAVRLQMTS